MALRTPGAETRETYTNTLSYLATCISMVCGGTTSLFATYGSSFSEVLGFTQYETNLVASLGDYAHYMSAPLFGYLSIRIGPTRVIQTAGILMFLGYFGLSYAFNHFNTPFEHANHYVATMSLLFALVGVGSKAAYMSSMATTARNFKHSRLSGIALGIPISLYGLSTFVFSSLKARWFEADATPARYLSFMAVVSVIAHVLAAQFVVLKDEPARRRAGSAAAKAPQTGTAEGKNSAPSESIEMTETRRRRMTVSAGAADDDSDTLTLTGDNQLAANNNADQKAVAIGNDPAHDTPASLMHAAPATGAGHAALPTYEQPILQRFGRDPIAWAMLLGIICFSGPGMAFVNNCGSMVRAMSHNTTLTAEQVGQYKDKIVATQSFFSFSSRLVVGYLSDIWRTRLRLPRSGLLILAALLMIHAQNTAARVSRLEDLYPLAVLIGISMGSAFTLAPTITSETWGAENFGICWGFITLGPAVGGHICNLIFGASWDQGLMDIAKRLGPDVPQDRIQCDRNCFVPAFLTTVRLSYFGLLFFVVVLCLPRVSTIWKQRHQ
ncbi:MFS general substrate transporter [Martensiomyces pterosporus]|nr:MFS general substrate transporter [Martensiomyces pterosporus]